LIFAATSLANNPTRTQKSHNGPEGNANKQPDDSITDETMQQDEVTETPRPTATESITDDGSAATPTVVYSIKPGPGTGDKSVTTNDDVNTNDTTPMSVEPTTPSTPTKNIDNEEHLPGTPKTIVTNDNATIDTDETSPSTPTRANSQKKRARKRGTRAKKVQKTIDKDDSRTFKCTNIHTTRFDLSFNLDPSTKPMEITKKKIQDILTAFREYSDETICFLPWKESDESAFSIINTIEDVPKQLSALRHYFPRLRLSPKGGMVYTSMLLGHDASAEDIAIDISMWTADSGVRVFKKSIQAEESAILGWFLYGIREINTNNLAEAINLFQDSSVEVGLRQMRIRTAVNGKASAIRAMGIECDARQELEAKDLLIKIYHSKSTAWPLGIKLRYMRDVRFLCGSQAVKKTVHLLGRHDRFQTGIKVRRIRDIQSLDIEDASTGRSLRDILMSLRSNKKPSLSLFHSVDPAFNDPDSHVLTFVPDFMDQADAVLSQLVPYLKFLEGEYIEKFFTAEALSRAVGCEWDESKGCAISALDSELDEIEILDEGYDISNPSKPSNVLDLTQPQIQEPTNRTLFGNDDDSVSTMGTTKTSFKPLHNVGAASVASSVVSDLSLRTKASMINSIKEDLKIDLTATISELLLKEFKKTDPFSSKQG